MTEPFVHLHLHSEFSIADGTVRIPALIEQCVQDDMPAVALTDLGIDSLMALEVMVSLSKKYQIEIPEEEFAPLENVNDAVDLVMEHVKSGKAVGHAQAS